VGIACPSSNDRVWQMTSKMNQMISNISKSKERGKKSEFSYNHVIPETRINQQLSSIQPDLSLIRSRLLAQKQLR
jgi:hypothetical protein